MQRTWRSPPVPNTLPSWLEQVALWCPEPAYADRLAQLLWQRQLATPESLAGFFDPQQYQPTPATAFGEEMTRAIARLQAAMINPRDRLLIWGDFDADGLTATAVLWEGLGQYFPQSERLFWTIPDRLQESHGLNQAGLEQALADGMTLLITCDTGCSDAELLQWACDRGLDVIVTDHHTLLPDRPPVTALINPRTLPADHPLATLSGVAVAYKLIEALYQVQPLSTAQPLEHLLDLVAIGLIADLVELRGDCRYLAQRGLQQLQTLTNGSVQQSRRPGITALLDRCQRSGDRPSDIAFGIGPRLNAVSRLQGKADLALELLTGRDAKTSLQLAAQVEELNDRRKRLQQDLLRELEPQLEQQRDRAALVLVGEGWHLGLLGLVAGQIAQREGKPTVLLNLDPADHQPRLARGSARSVNGLNLYELLDRQRSHLLKLGGHPCAAGLSLVADNLPLLREALEQRLRQLPERPISAIAPDLEVTVADLDRPLFRTLYKLEPCGMGNPTPRLALYGCYLQKQRREWTKGVYGRARFDFQITDPNSGAMRSGYYWPETNAETLPAETQRCDLVVELDLRTSKGNLNQRDLVARLIAWRSHQPVEKTESPRLLDWRSQAPDSIEFAWQLTTCPWTWQELALAWQQAQRSQQPLALSYTAPVPIAPHAAWQQWLAILRAIATAQKPVPWQTVSDRLGWPLDLIQASLQICQPLGYRWQAQSDSVQMVWPDRTQLNWQSATTRQTQQQWQRLLREWQRRRQFFSTASLQTLAAGLHDRYNLGTFDPA